MKTRTLALMTTALMAVLPQAFAASSTDLAVQGLITPSACTLLLSGGGMIDHGKISVKDLNPGGTVLQPTTLQMSTTCEGKTLMAVRAIDNRAGSASFLPGFGLGLANGDHKLGYYYIKMRNMVADGTTVTAIMSPTGDDWVWGEDYLDPGLLFAFSSNFNVPTPLALERLDMEFFLLTIIDKTEGLDMSDEIALDGSATLEVKYL
jgi:hypothetical protein